MQDWIRIVVLSALLVGCQGANQPDPDKGSAAGQEVSATTQVESSTVPQESSTTSQESPAELVRCTGERPEACAQIYKPVCAQKSSTACAGETCSRWKTYGNACTACSDPQVKGYIKGACEAR